GRDRDAGQHCGRSVRHGDLRRGRLPGEDDGADQHRRRHQGNEEGGQQRVQGGYEEKVAESDCQDSMRSRTERVVADSPKRQPMMATESAPADQTSRAFSGVIPPMATRGFSIRLRQRRISSMPTTGSGLPLEDVAKMGPMAT